VLNRPVAAKFEFVEKALKKLEALVAVNVNGGVELRAFPRESLCTRSKLPCDMPHNVKYLLPT
jgi:hypothetical protein